ncbi:hypothetical protein A3Q56_01618 [Intoshia linei]|uniref:Protein kinase domain-containing protein n=1 Tax=Intoshia linei TaxID=1819745 RepID=A0A177BAG8_9BILA|nr:hypothetical protein A3Q56_01618 [Intoshia linei]
MDPRIEKKCIERLHISNEEIWDGFEFKNKEPLGDIEMSSFFKCSCIKFTIPFFEPIIDGAPSVVSPTNLQNKFMNDRIIKIFLRQIVSVLELFNRENLVHRDLKPQNILLHYNGDNKSFDNVIIKIADFGFAKILNDGVMARTYCGSPLYMAPEIILNRKYDLKADIWSIGAILFECITNKHPYTANNPHTLRQIIMRSKNVTLKLHQNVCPTLKSLIDHMLIKDPKNRCTVEQLKNHKFLSQKILNAVSNRTPTFIKVKYSTKRIHLKNIENEDKKPELAKKVDITKLTDEGFVIVPRNMPESDTYGNISAQPKRKFNLTDVFGINNLDNSYFSTTEIPLEQECLSVSGKIDLQNASYKRYQHRSGHLICFDSLTPPSVQFSVGTPPSGMWQRSQIPFPSSSFVCGLKSGCKFDAKNEKGLYKGFTNKRRAISAMNFSLDNENLHQHSCRILTEKSLYEREDCSKFQFCVPTSLYATNISNKKTSQYNRSLYSLCQPDSEYDSELKSNTSNYTLNKFSKKDKPNQIITFYAPSLDGSAMMEKSHREGLSKLNYILNIVECIITAMSYESNEIDKLDIILNIGKNNFDMYKPLNDAIKVNFTKNLEKLVLHYRIIDLLKNALQMAVNLINQEKLQLCHNTVTVIQDSFEYLKLSISVATKLLNQIDLDCQKYKYHITQIPTADTILFKHAVKLCKEGIHEERLGSFEAAFMKYLWAYMLLHFFSFQASEISGPIDKKDKNQIDLLTLAVTKRLKTLQEFNLNQ